MHTGGAPCRAGESQNLPSATPLPSWRALGSCFPVRKIRFGSAGCLKKLHASDLKGKGAQEKLSTNVKITQPGVCLPGPCWSRDVCELRAGRSGSEVSRGTPRNLVRVCPHGWNPGEGIIVEPLGFVLIAPSPALSGQQNQPRALPLSSHCLLPAYLCACVCIYKYI